MSAVAPPTRVTPADLLRMPDRKRYELVNGQLVERKMSLWSSYVGGEIHALLRNFCRPKGLGWVLPEGTGYQCFPDEPFKVRKPDTSFIARERMPLARATEEGFITVAPDLAAEVVSPNDIAYEVEEKVQAFLRAGVRVVWVVIPPTRTVEVHRRDGGGVILREDDELTGDDVIPGFRCRVGDLFVPPFEPMPNGT
jgi:Uma2 family endonuclease